MRGDRPSIYSRFLGQIEVPPHGAGIGRCTRAKWPETGDGKQSGNAKRRTGRGRHHVAPFERGGFGAAQARLKQHEHDRAVERGNLWRVIPAWAGNTPIASN